MEIVKYNELTWIDFEDPTQKDVTYLQENFDVHPLAIEEFMTPTFRPRATKYSNCLFLTVHIPLFDVKERTTYPGEIDILLTRSHLITGHRKSIYQLDQFQEKLQKSIGKRRLYMSDTPAHLLYQLLKILLESCFPRVDHITKNIDEIEDHIFAGKEREMVTELSIVKRDILNFRRTLMPQRSILESIVAQPPSVVPQKIKPYYQDLVGTNIRLWNTLESAKETISSLEETNNSLLSEKINTKMRVLTIFSAILIPMTLYANVLGINTPIPLGENHNGFLIHISIMGLISVFTIVLFRIFKWI